MTDQTQLLLELASLPQAEFDALMADLPDTARAEVLGIAEIARKQQRIDRARVFGLDGFRAWFELAHGSPLHREGEKWAENIFKAIDGRKKLLQEAFRGSGKTTVMSYLFLAFYIGHHPETTNGVIRVNVQKANETTAAVANLISSDAIWKAVFPNVIPDDKVNDAEGKGRSWGEKNGYFVKRNDITDDEWDTLQRETQRPASSPTLIGYGYDSGSIQGFHTNGVLLIDDIHDKENTRSPRQLEDVKDFVKFQLLPIPIRNVGIEIWNFTPWKHNDAYAERKATGLYIHSLTPVMKEVPAGTPGAEQWPASFDDEVLDKMPYPFTGKWYLLSWPEVWDFRAMAEKYVDMGQLAFAREYLLDLEASKGRKLKAEWLGYWPGDDIRKNGASWPVVLGVDYASVSDKLKHKDRDYFALAVMRAIPGGGLVLETGTRAQLTKPEALAQVQRWAERYQTLHMIKVESIGKGEEFYNDLALLDDKFGKPLPLFAIASHGKASKGERFENLLGPRFEARRIWVSDTPDEFIDAFVNEWLTYPDSEHDDCLDAVYMAAVAGEAFTPSKAERTDKQRRETYNPRAAWSRN